jgi:curli biogenesis system outer membrane secretion channel CsgG
VVNNSFEIMEVTLMKRLLLLLIIGSLLFVCTSPAWAASKKIKVAVMNFRNDSQWRYWGEGLGQAANNEFVTQLDRTGHFTLIEREQLQAILGEQSLGASGAVAQSTAAKIGKLTGAQLIMTGSITSFSIKKQGGSFMGVGAAKGKAESKLDVRFIDTTTGETVLTAVGSGSKGMGGFSFRGTSFEQEYDEGVASEALRPAVEQAVKEIVANVAKLQAYAGSAGAGKVLDAKSPTQIYIDGGTEAGMNAGDVFAVYRVTEEIKDDDGNVLDTVTEKVGEIVVTRVLNKSAVCEARSGSPKKGDTYRKE